MLASGIDTTINYLYPRMSAGIRGGCRYLKCPYEDFWRATIASDKSVIIRKNISEVRRNQHLYTEADCATLKRRSAVDQEMWKPYVILWISLEMEQQHTSSLNIPVHSKNALLFYIYSFFIESMCRNLCCRLPTFAIKRRLWPYRHDRWLVQV